MGVSIPLDVTGKPVTYIKKDSSNAEAFLLLSILYYSPKTTAKQVVEKCVPANLDISTTLGDIFQEIFLNRPI